MKDSIGVSLVSNMSNGQRQTQNGNGHGSSNGEPGTKKVEDPVVSCQKKQKENGFEEWGGYMAAKRAKLDNQINASTKNGNSGFFSGISIYINGYTDPPENQLREMFILNGGTFHTFNSLKTTYVIATNLSAPSKKLYASKTLIPEWITESVAAGTKLDPRKYMLHDLNEEKNQPTLTQVINGKNKPSSVSNANNPVPNITSINGASASKTYSKPMDRSIKDLYLDFNKPKSDSKFIQKAKTHINTTFSRGRQMVDLVLNKPSCTITSSNASNDKQDSEFSLHPRVKNVVVKNGNYHEILTNGKTNGTSSSPETNGINGKVNGYSRSPTPPDVVDEMIPPVPKKHGKRIASNGEVPDSCRLPSLPKKNNTDEGPVDINVLRELPEDIRREMAQHYGIDISDLNEDMDWVEREEVRRDAAIPSLPVIDETNDQAASDTIDSVLRESAAAAANPYENVESIDPSFLCALPDALRNEVLLQFQEAKGRKGIEMPINLTNSPQPCSSRQALERDRIRNEEGSQTNGNGPYHSNSLDPDAVNLYASDEDMFADEDDNKTTQQEQRKSTSHRRKSTARRLNFEGQSTPMSSKRKLFTNDINDEETKVIKDESNHEVKKIRIKKADIIQKEQEMRNLNKNQRRVRPILKPIGSYKPSLTGAMEVEDVRNVLRQGLESVDEPSEDDVESLMLYFDELVRGGWLKQTESLLKFINRKKKTLDENSFWYEILSGLIMITQGKMREVFGGGELYLSD